MIKWCHACKTTTEHDHDPYAFRPADEWSCQNNYGACEDCERTLHGPNEDDTAHVTESEKWVCGDCIKKNYDEFGVKL